MKKIIASFTFLVFLLLFFYLIPLTNKPVFAAEDNCLNAIYYPNIIYENSDNIMFVFVLDKDRADTTPNAKYAVKADDGITYPPFQNSYVSEVLTPQDDAGNGKVIRGSIMRPQWSPQFDSNPNLTHNLKLYRLSSQQPPINLNLGQTPEWDKLNTVYCQKKIEYKVLKPISPTPKPLDCNISPQPSNPSVTDPINITINIPQARPKEGIWQGKIEIKDGNGVMVQERTISIDDTTPFNKTIPFSSLDNPGVYDVVLNIILRIAGACWIGVGGGSTTTCLPDIYEIRGTCFAPKMNVAPPGVTGFLITLTPTPIVTAIPTQAMWAPTYTPTPYIARPSLGALCDQMADKKADTKDRHPNADCKACLGPPDSTISAIWSAIGCIPTDYGKLISKYFFPIGTGIAGGISFLYFLYGAFLILTSSGNPEKIEEAKQIIISALSGLLLIIFSIFLLRVIGVSILKIPDFT